jgi:hypothetical protein
MTTESLAWASLNAYSLPFTIEFNQKFHRKTELIRSALSQTLLIHIFVTSQISPRFRNRIRNKFRVLPI